MNELTIQNMVLVANNEVITTSLKVAEYFGRKHKDVLKAINKLQCSKEFNERNFARVDYLDEKGEKRPMFNITRDGCMFLIMGFTGKKAAEIKEAYIYAFNYMTEFINNSKLSLQQQMNTVMLEFMKEKDVASMSGRLLNRWGKVKKPELTKQIQQLQQQSQLKLLA